MRGAYYVVTALLILATSLTAAESGQPTQLQTYDHDVASVNVSTTTLPQRFLLGSRDVAPTTVDEERTSFSKIANIAKISKISNIAEITMKSETNAHLTDAEIEVLALRTALIEASTGKQPMPQVKPPGDTGVIVDAFHPFIKTWVELTPDQWAKEVNLYPRTSKNNPVNPDETPKAGQPDTSHEWEYFTPLLATKTKQRRSSLYKQYRALAPGRSKAPTKLNTFKKIDRAKLKPIHDAFSKLCHPYSPTETETASIYSIMRLRDSSPSRNRLTRKANIYVIENLMTLMEDDLMWNRWISLTDSQRVALLNNSLNAHRQRWITMVAIFRKTWPRVSKTKIRRKIKAKTRRGKKTLSRVDDNIGKRRDLAPPVLVEWLTKARRGERTRPRLNSKDDRRSNRAPPDLVESEDHDHLVEPTSPGLMTKVFGSDSGQKKQPRVDIIGRSSDPAPPGLVESGDHHLIEPTSNELMTKDFKSNSGQRKRPRVEIIGQSSDPAPPGLVEFEDHHSIEPTFSEMLRKDFEFESIQQKRPRLDDNTDRNSDLASPRLVESEDHQLVWPTSSGLMTRDFGSDSVQKKQPRVDIIGRSSDHAPPGLVESGDHHLIEPTSSELMTRDFLYELDQMKLPQVDDNVGESSDLASPRLALYEDHDLIEPTSSELITRDFVSKLGQKKRPRQDDNIDRNSVLASPRLVESEDH